MTGDHGPEAFRGARPTAAGWTRRVRIVLGITLLLFSIALLIWGLLPAQPEIRTQPISPAELQLPTPVSLIADGISRIAIRDK